MAAINTLARRFFASTTAMGRKVLVCSIGNPGAEYVNTRHSAGNIMNDYLREAFGYSQFGKNKPYSGKVSFPENNQVYTLWQSQSLMNISGKGVRAAWNSFRSGLDPEERGTAVLVVLHDELDVELGRVKVKKTGSAGGHNGLISIIQSLQTQDFHRIGVGIGRPSRHEGRDQVIKHVLGELVPRERITLGEKSVPLVIEELRKIAGAPDY